MQLAVRAWAGPESQVCYRFTKDYGESKKDGEERKFCDGWCEFVRRKRQAGAFKHEHTFLQHK